MIMILERTCSQPGCDLKPFGSSTLCRTHYQEIRRTPKYDFDIVARFVDLHAALLVVETHAELIRQGISIWPRSLLEQHIIEFLDELEATKAIGRGPDS